MPHLSLESVYKLLGPFARIDHRADRPDHVEDPGDASLMKA
jgi:hypothetical protein